METIPLYGLMAEFRTPEALLHAAERASQQGFKRMDAYTPFPIDGLAEALNLRSTRVPLIVLAGGLIGCLGGYFLQYWLAAINYPLNVGGRPLNSWPAFIPVTFEMTILCAALAAFLGVLALNGLPMPYHPVFNVERFELASGNRFFLCIEARDPNFDRDATQGFLESLNPEGVYPVER